VVRSTVCSPEPALGAAAGNSIYQVTPSPVCLKFQESGDDMADNICIAIAVSRPEGLDEVPGAIASAKRVIAWAAAQGFDAELVTDEAEPVTCAHPSGGFRHLKTTYTTLSGHQPARWGGLARTRPSPQFRGVGKTL